MKQSQKFLETMCHVETLIHPNNNNRPWSECLEASIFFAPPSSKPLYGLYVMYQP